MLTKYSTIGDLHDGNGLSDATDPNGKVTNPIFENIDYDLLTPGNHELGAVDVAYNTFTEFVGVYGDKYLTSNIDICNNCQDGEPDDKEWVSMGSRSRYFKTKSGIRIMAFGVILDKTNNNKDMTRIQPAKEMIQEDWFKDAVTRQDIDLFLLIGHNPVRLGDPKSVSFFPFIMETLREMRPDIPIQGFGGHTHNRDFRVYDSMSSAIESGKYCETVGWISLSGIKSQQTQSSKTLETKHARIRESTSARTNCNKTNDFDMQLTRRYLDWNRLTFAYHATGSQDMDTSKGLDISKSITENRKALNLTYVYGCAPRTYCQSCRPFGDPGNVYTLLQSAAAATVVNPDRSTNSRMIILNAGLIRYDVVQGPFTVDDSYTVSPYQNTLRFIPDVPYSLAKKIIESFNAPSSTKRSMAVDTVSSGLLGYDECGNPSFHNETELSRPKTLFRRMIDENTPTPGYTTCDDLGDDGDDTPHSEIPEYSVPAKIQATAGFPSDGVPDIVDMIFPGFLQPQIIDALNSQNMSTSQSLNYTSSDTDLYLPTNFTTFDIIPTYASMMWQDNSNNCSIAG